MANFGGHAIPGTFFLLYGLWLAVKHTLRHRWRKGKTPGRPKAPTFLRKMEYVEGGFMMFAAFVGIMVEQFVVDGPHARLYSGGAWVKLMNWQHSTMYLFFGIAGFANVTSLMKSMPLGIDRMSISLALFVEGFLFYYHLHNRPLLDAHVHTLLLVPVFVGSANAMLQVFLRDNIILELSLACLFFLQGSWFYQIGCVLFPLSGPKWDLTLHNNVMFTTMCFCWHIAMALLIISIVALLVCSIVKRVSGESRNVELGMRNTTNSSQKALLDDTDED
ncbi:transmembrane protein 45B [Gadus morhua]|uniref:Transmembrane protein 45B n=1 Tax=Gadus morhua TaxID=8049 RepID=A0A8C4ZS65_GADMO|nr:transmembrane protein 45B-like [Gadus morhua]XP_030216346.1 transmembrane protein 45B-like [Gadus morhua]